jgi:YVTN family beta-propeller protein
VNFGEPTHFRWTYTGFTVGTVAFDGVEFSVRWTGFVDITTPGNYTFGLKSDDGSWLYIDGLMAINDGNDHGSSRMVKGVVSLGSGLHSIQVDYYETCRDKSSGIDLYWITPGTSVPVIVPTTVLIPPTNPYATTVSCFYPAFVLNVTTTCTASVKGLSPSGTVSWSESGPGGISFSPASCTLSSGECQVNVTGTALGFVTLNASYAGDQNNPPGSVTFTTRVGIPTATDTTVSCRPLEVTIESSRRFRCTATVTGLSPTGTVVWFPTANATMGVGRWPEGAAFASSNNEVYVTNWGSNTVSVISASTNTVVGTIPVGIEPGDVVFSPSSKEVYVTNWGSNTVSVISASTNTVVGTIPVGDGPGGIAFASSDNDLYVANYWSNTVSVISASTNTVVGTIPVGIEPGEVAFAPSNNDAYVTNHWSNTVSVISASTNAVVKTIDVGVGPEGITFASSDNDLYVANYWSNTVSVISASTNNVTGSPIAVGVGPWGVTFASSNDHNDTYVTNWGSNTVSVISTSSNAVAATIPISVETGGVVGIPVAIGWAPSGVAFASTNKNLYVTDIGLDTVYAVSIGLVQFNETTSSVPSGEATCTLVSGHCSMTMTGVIAGSVTLKAVYEGNGVNTPSSGKVAYTVEPARTHLSLSCIATSEDVWTCAATLKHYHGSVGGESIAWYQLVGKGSVSFSSSSCILSSAGTCSVVVTGRVATRMTVTIEAVYAGDIDNLGSFRTKSLRVK